METWDIATGKQIAAWKVHEVPKNIGIIPSVEFAGNGQVVTGGLDKAVCFWDPATGKKLRQFDGIVTTVGSLAVSPDGKLLACVETKESPPNNFGGERKSHRIELRDAITGKVLRRLVGPETRDDNGTAGYFRCLAFSPDGKTLAAGGYRIGVQVWEVATGATRRAFGPFPYPVALAFSADGKTVAVASASSCIHLYDPATGAETTSVRELRGTLFRISLSHDGKTLASTEGGSSCVLVSTETGKPQRRLDGPAGSRMHEPVLSADGKTLVALGENNTLCAWGTADGAVLRQGRSDHLTRHARLLAVSPDGSVVAVAGDDSSVPVIETRTGTLRRRLSSGPAIPLGAAFLPGDRSIVVWSGDRTARVWDLATGAVVRQVQYSESTRPAAPGKVMRQELMTRGETNVYYKAAVSADGRRIAFGYHRTGLIAVHDLHTGDEVGRAEGLPAGLQAFALSPDGRTVAYGADGDPAVRLLEVAGGKERHAYTGHGGDVVSVGFSADGRRLVSGSRDTTGLVWDLTARSVADKPESLWRDLASADAARAYRAVRGLAAAPEAEAFLLARVTPTPPTDPKRLAKLIADLDSDTFAARDAAAAELEKLGDRAAGALRTALAAGMPLEPRRRAEALLKRLAAEAREPSAERLRLTRAVEVLEMAAARELLAELAKGAAGAWLTEEAKAALRRVGARRGGR